MSTKTKFLMLFFGLIYHFAVSSSHFSVDSKNQELLNTVVALAGKKYYLQLNDGKKYRYPNLEESFKINDAKFIEYVPASTGYVLQLHVGREGKTASVCVDEFFNNGGVIECASACHMVLFAIWRDLLGVDAFNNFMADLKDVQTYSMIGHLEARVGSELSAEELKLMRDDFWKKKRSFRVNNSEKIKDKIILDGHFFPILTSFMHLDDARGLLREITDGEYELAAPIGCFSYFSNLPSYKVWHPDGNDSGMNGLVVDKDKFMGLSLRCRAGGMTILEYEQMHYESLLLTDTIQMPEVFAIYRGQMTCDDGAKFKKEHNALNLDQDVKKEIKGKFAWLFFDYEILSVVWKEFVRKGNQKSRINSMKKSLSVELRAFDKKMKKAEVVDQAP